MNQPISNRKDNKRARIAIMLVLITGLSLVAFLTGRYQDQIVARLFEKEYPKTELVPTSFYTLEMKRLDSPAGGRDGGIAAISGGILIADHSGEIWFYDDDKFSQSKIKVPTNFYEFSAIADKSDIVSAERFGVKDILTFSSEGRTLLFASFNHWDAERDCYSLNVAYTTLEEYTNSNDTERNFDGDWKDLFRSEPCLPLSSMSGSTTRRPTESAGGRLARYSSEEILLSIGDFGGYKRGRALLPQELDNAYGKTVLINFRTGNWRIFSLGHRNPQGLVITADNKIWSTEHGPQGGDELNLIKDGSNYGFPYVTYGTEYGKNNWPLNPEQGHHDGYQKPTFSWNPSIATSQLEVITKDRFPIWQGDLIVSALKGKSLYRIHLEEDAVILIEPINIGHRIRDITELLDGRLALKTDDGFLILLRPTESESLEGLSQAQRGKLLAQQCQGCHTFNEGGTDGIGPNLYGIYNRPIAAGSDYSYSIALAKTSGIWNQENLRAFLTNPSAFAPGTTMEFQGAFTKEQITDIIDYLTELN